MKPVQAILQLLWEMAHIPEIPKHLVERAFAEHLATINEMTLNKDAVSFTIQYAKIVLDVSPDKKAVCPQLCR